MKDLLRRLATATEPDAGVTDRLRARLSPPSAGPALRGVGDVAPGVVGRLQSGMAARRTRRAPRRAWVGAGAVVLLAVGWIATDGETPPVTVGRDSLVGDGGQVGEPAVADEGSGTTVTGSDGSRSPLSHRDDSAPGRVVGDLVVDTSPGVSPPLRLPTPSPSRPAGSLRAATPRARLSSPGPSLGAPDAVPAPQDLAMVVAPMPTPTVADAASPAAAPPVAPFASLRLPAGVALDRSGRRSTVRWEVGTLTAGLSAPGLAELAIVTREGLTRVEDGEVAVTRDRLGTRVTVRDGSATVACEGGAEEALTQGDTAECLPTRALGWLGRAEALHEAGAPLADVLAATSSGRAAGPTDPAYGELVALEVDVLRATGDLDAARAAAARYPADGPRAAEMSHFQKP